jgi:hypothetical protein
MVEIECFIIERRRPAISTGLHRLLYRRNFGVELDRRTLCAYYMEIWCPGFGSLASDRPEQRSLRSLDKLTAGKAQDQGKATSRGWQDVVVFLTGFPLSRE